MSRIDELRPSCLPDTHEEKSVFFEAIHSISTWVRKKVGSLERKTMLGITGAVALHTAVAMTPMILSPDSQPAPAQIDTSDLPELKLKTDQEIIDELYERDKKKVEAKEKERSKRIDPEKSKAHRQEVAEQIQAGKPPTFDEFLSKKDLFSVGIEPEIVERGQKIIEQRIQKLRSQKGRVPARNLLTQLAFLIYDYSDDDHPLDMTCTDAYEYVVTQEENKTSGQQICTSCQARFQTVALYLEKLFPEYRDKIFLQDLDMHTRTGIEIAGKKYAIDGGAVTEVTKDNKAGTYLYKPLRLMKVYAGLPVEKLVQEPGHYPTGKRVRFIKDNAKLDAGIASDEPLRKFNDDPAGLYGDFNQVKRRYQEEYQKKVQEREQILAQGSTSVQPFFELTEVDNQTLTEEAINTIEARRAELKTSSTPLLIDLEQDAHLDSPSPEFITQLSKILNKEKQLIWFDDFTIPRHYSLNFGNVSSYNPHILTDILNLKNRYPLGGGLHFKGLPASLQIALSEAEVNSSNIYSIEIDMDGKATAQQLEKFFRQGTKSKWILKFSNLGPDFRITSKLLKAVKSSRFSSVDLSEASSEIPDGEVFEALRDFSTGSTTLGLPKKYFMKMFEYYPELILLKNIFADAAFNLVVGGTLFEASGDFHTLLPAIPTYLQFKQDKESFIMELESYHLRGYFRAIIDLYETYYFLQDHDYPRREAILSKLREHIQFQEDNTHDGEPRIILENIKEAAKNFAAQRGMNQPI